MAEADRRLHTETDIEAYGGYIPDDWGEKTVGPLQEGTVLERLVLDLSLGWRSAAYTAQMPATSVRAMHAVARGRASVVTPDSSIVAYSEQIIASLCQRVPELVENSSLRARRVAELATISDEFRGRATAVKDGIRVDPFWATLMADTAFRISLWSSQRFTYVAFYNAYEAFLVDCVKVATGATSLRTQNDDFKKGLRTAFARDIADLCWFHTEINVAKLVRHALSHNGGGEAEDLKKQTHGIRLIEGELQIVPRDIRRMLSRLRIAVDEVITVAGNDPKFSAPVAKMPNAHEG